MSHWSVTRVTMRIGQEGFQKKGLEIMQDTKENEFFSENDFFFLGKGSIEKCNMFFFK